MCSSANEHGTPKPLGWHSENGRNHRSKTTGSMLVFGSYRDPGKHLLEKVRPETLSFCRAKRGSKLHFPCVEKGMFMVDQSTYPLNTMFNHYYMVGVASSEAPSEQGSCLIDTYWGSHPQTRPISFSFFLAMI